ncbi:MAG: MCE family protein [Candidatus Binataceae bacterium]|nr:MCE family protein [Candidatus Binataceae bacterium]
MAARGNPRTVGAFVVGALALAIAATLLLGSERLFGTTHEFVCFFEGSVNGLRIGAAVKFKGVEIGSVTKILLSLNVGPATSAFASSTSIKIPVIIELDEGRMLKRGAAYVNLEDPEGMKLAIRQGLRAQLSTESLLTGLLYIDLDMHPHAPARFSAPPNSSYPEIPTLPTVFELAQSTANRLVKQLDQVQLDLLVTTATQALAAVRDLASSPDLKAAMVSLRATSASLDRTADSLRVLSDNLDRQVAPMAHSVEKTAQTADATLLKAQLTLDQINNALAPNAPLLYQANRTLTDVDDAARSLRQLTDYINRNPGALVRGRSYNKDAQ